MAVQGKKPPLIFVTTVTQLKIAIAGYMQREPSVFVRTVGNASVDLLLFACNNARLHAERLVDFEYSRQDCKVEVDRTDGGSLAFATEVDDVNTGVSVKKIVSPFLPAQDGTRFPVELWSRKKWNDKVRRRLESFQPRDNRSTFPELFAQTPFVVVQEGRTVFVAPADETQFPTNPFDLYFNVVSWLPSYVTGSEDDFLLEFGLDWMLFYSIHQLNFYLKEDERVMVSSDVRRDTWDSLVKWNSELTMSSTDDTKLD